MAPRAVASGSPPPQAARAGHGSVAIATQSALPPVTRHARGVEGFGVLSRGEPPLRLARAAVPRVPVALPTVRSATPVVMPLAFPPRPRFARGRHKLRRFVSFS